MGCPTAHDVSNVSVVYNILKSDGTLDGLTPANPSPATRTLGSAIPTRVVNANTLEFPGGALEGFAPNDIVVVQTVGGKKAYLVTSVDAGNAPVFSHLGNVPQTDATGTFTTAEKKGTLVLGAYTNVTITLNTTNDTTFGGAGAVPDFKGVTLAANAASLNVPVGQMILVKVSVTARNSTLNTDGSVDYVLTAKDSSNGSPSTISCSVGTFKSSQLTIKKEVRNFSTSGAFAAGLTLIADRPSPGQILEYKVTVANASGQAAQVVVSDVVPAYTTLVTHSGAYGSGGGDITDKFAQILDGANTVNVTPSGSDSEAQPLAGGVITGFGKAIDIDTVTTPAVFDAGSALTFYLGDIATNSTGGKLPYCSDGISTTAATCVGPAHWITSLTILYQVKID